MRTFAWLSLALLGCNDGERFIPLPELCTVLAGDVCDARGSCCTVDPAACLMGEEQRCRDAVGPYEKEPTLTYDAVAAARQRSNARSMLDRCEPPPPLASFFQGGAALGASCERDSQCASGRCFGEPRSCAEPAIAPLCPPP